MFRQILHAHWKSSQLALLPLTVAAFGLPVMSVSTFSFTYFEAWSLAYPLLAVIAGLFLAVSAWAWDIQGNHVYSLSLPLPRWKYSLLRMAAGALTVLIPGVALWVGCRLATATATLPAGIRAYPEALSIRFVSASLVAYAICFALMSGRAKTQIGIVSGMIGVFVASGILISLGLSVDLGAEFVNLLVLWPGPLEVFFGSWLLFNA